MLPAAAMKIGGGRMNWTELKQYAPLTDVKKFVKYASENRLLNSEICNPDSYFSVVSESREHVIDNIMEYDFFDMEKIEELFGTVLAGSGLTNVDVLLRITAASMLRNKPKETGLREYYKANEALVSETGRKAANVEMNNVTERTPPQFYYPM